MFILLSPLLVVDTGVLNTVIPLVILLYVFLAMRTVYGQSVGRTLVKFFYYS